MRLASLACSNTEIVAALGLAEHLVAVDSHSDAPEAAHAERLGPDLNIDVARLVALQPDLTLASLSVPGMERVVNGVRAARLRHLTLDPLSLEGVYQDIRTIGAALDVPSRAAELVFAMQAELDGLRGAKRPAPRVVIEWWPRPVIVAAGAGWVNDVLHALGAENAFGRLDARSAPVRLEDLRAARPDLHVVAWCGAKKLRPEVAEARGLGVPVVAIPESGLGRPGPRLLEGARMLGAALASL